MIHRKFWLEKIESAWAKKSVIWLQGVRRVGKTTLCKSIEGLTLFDCEKPSHRRLLEDPESFFENLDSEKIAIDEIHRLENPAEVLKIAADYFPKIKVIATGSSTLQAKKKFKDTLTDRKRVIWLTPFNMEDILLFQSIKKETRLLRGGLPPFLLSEDHIDESFVDWIDSYWAKDVQELFNITNKNSFMKFMELIALQSGGLFEAQSFAPQCEVSRPTIMNYLNALEQTNIAVIVRPFFKNKSKEVTSAPKVYFFDTGFISYFNGWTELHDQDKGLLWEHFVLNELLSIVHKDDIFYWRDKSKNEVDFIIKSKSKPPILIECKWKYEHFNSSIVNLFRRHHPGAHNLIVTSNVLQAMYRKSDSHKLHYLGVQDLGKTLQKILKN